MRLHEVMPMYLEYAHLGGPKGIDAENAYWASEAAIQQAEIEQQRRSEYYLYEYNPRALEEDERELERFGPFDPWGDADDRPF